jgi:hypothetical protein
MALAGFLVNLFYPPTSRVSHDINQLQPGVPGYTFITQSLTEIESELDNSEISYTEGDFQNLRVCKAPRKYKDSRPRGERYLDHLIADLDGCIEKKRDYHASGVKIEVFVNRSSPNVSEVQRQNGSTMETLVFCSCPQSTIDLVKGDSRYN